VVGKIIKHKILLSISDDHSYILKEGMLHFDTVYVVITRTIRQCIVLCTRAFPSNYYEAQTVQLTARLN